MATILQKLLVAAAAVTSVLAQPSPNRAVDPALFPSLPSSEKLVWRDCYEKFKCARLDAPGDVSKPNCRGLKPKEKVQLAVIKFPDQSGAPKKGVVHVALGGWSSSSTNFLVNWAESYSPLFPGYDLLAIDYRGTGWTTPSYRCFASEDERQAWAASEPPVLGSSAKVLPQRQNRARDFADRCLKNGGDVGKYMGTYANAVDHYRVMKADNRTKLSWWGVSSGAHLGQTVALLYPDAVDKFLFDAAPKSDQVYDISFAQADSIKDAEKGMNAFFYACITAPTQCAFAGSSTTVDQLKDRYNKIDKALLTSSIPVPNAKGFDYSSLHLLLNVVLHEASFFPLLGGVLAEVENKTAGEAIAYATGLLAAPPAKLPLLDSSPAFEALATGVCLDEKNHVRNIREFTSYLLGMLKAVPSIGGFFANYRLNCMEWKINPVNVFPGRFKKTRVAGNIVYIGNTADPAASIDNAKYMSNILGPSRVIKDNGIGHTTFSGSTSSFCLFGVMVSWFGNNTLPDPSTVCPPGGPPFGVQLPANF